MGTFLRATIDEIQHAVDICRSVGNDDIIVLKCTSAYPAPLEEANLKDANFLNTNIKQGYYLEWLQDNREENFEVVRVDIHNKEHKKVFNSYSESLEYFKSEKLKSAYV